MKDGVILGFGKSNPDWNNSAPHGAGRKMARTQAIQQLSLAQFAEKMQGVYSTCVAQDTLSEAPMAYKDPDDILTWIAQTVDIKYHLKSVYNFKAGEE